MPEDKPSEAQKFVAEFLEWVLQFVGGDNMLYRGLADESWEVEASLYRRLGGKDNPASKEKFIQASEELVRTSQAARVCPRPCREVGRPATYESVAALRRGDLPD